MTNETIKLTTPIRASLHHVDICRNGQAIAHIHNMEHFTHDRTMQLLRDGYTLVPILEDKRIR
jgi:hypothetical protein